ncbi:MAG: MFS transporter, partial [Planctomycetota bacterium]
MSAPTEIPAENDADIDTPEAASGDTQVTQTALIPAEYLYPFVLVTTLFALWGFANNYTDPLVRAFKEIFLISNFESSLVQLAFYGGYGTMAIPAALVIRKYSFKTGIIVGLALYAIGALLTIPASLMMAFWLFLISFYILTFGLAFLETAANPYILSMGPEQSATRRLNFAQAFNPVGTLTGMFVASTLILPYLDVAEFRNEYTTVEVAAEDGTTSRVLKPEFEGQLPSVVDGAVGSAMEELRENDPERFSAMQSHDHGVVRLPYVAIAAVVLGGM